MTTVTIMATTAISGAVGALAALIASRAATRIGHGLLIAARADLSPPKEDGLANIPFSPGAAPAA